MYKMRFHKKTGIHIVLFCCLLYCNSCKQISQSINDTFKGRPEKETGPLSNPVAKALIERAKSGPKQNYVSDTAYLQKAEKELENLPELKGREIMLYNMVYFYGDGRISVKVQDPDEPRHINGYWYKEGLWQQPQPIQLSKNNEESIAEHVFPLADFSFLTANKVWENYKQRAAGIEGAKPATNVYFIFRDNKRYSLWYPTSIDGSRERWDIWFNERGDVVKFERN